MRTAAPHMSRRRLIRPCKAKSTSHLFSDMLSCLSDNGEFVTVGRESRAVFDVAAIDAEDQVVDASWHCVPGLVIELVISRPDGDAPQAQDGGCVVFRHRNPDAAAFAIDRAAVADFMFGILSADRFARSAGVEVPFVDIETKGLGDLALALRKLRCDQRLHGEAFCFGGLGR